MNRLPKAVPITFGLLLSVASEAATLSWPGSAPCDTTLQSCVDAAMVNDTILIGSGAGEITTPLVIGKPLTVKSAPTARARFVNTTLLIQSSFAGTGNRNVLENVQLVSTPLTVSMGSNEPADEHVVELNQLEISGDTGLLPGIGLTTPQTPSAKTLRIRHLRYLGGVGFGHPEAVPYASVEISDSQFIANRAAAPVTIILGGTNQVTLRRNRIEALAAIAGDCFKVQAISGASISADIDRNVMLGCETGVGLLAQAGATALHTRVRNNTFRTSFTGLTLQGAVLNGIIDNNIFVKARDGAIRFFGGATASLAHNLYHEASQPAVFELNPIVADPQFVSMYDLHLRPGSPAINAAIAGSVPAGGDFEGVSSGAPTIGAFNYHYGGADIHGATSENSFSNYTVVPENLSRPFTEVMVQSLIDGFPLPAWSPNHLGVYSTSSAPLRTVIFGQNQQSILPPRRFFVLDSNRHSVHGHVADAGNTNGHITYLDWSPLNGNPLAKPQVQQRAIPQGGVINNRAIGVWFDSSNARWAIFNQDQVAMQQGAMFDVILPELTAPYSFVGSAAAGTSLDLILDHPLLNNSPCAAVFVTPVFQGVYLTSAVHARFRPTTNGGGRWTVLRGDGSLFQNGMDMHVYADPARSRACLSDGVFGDSME